MYAYDMLITKLLAEIIPPVKLSTVTREYIDVNNLAI
jgi:hypothetical protein